ncbi:MAG: tRNA (cytidine(34)-2'-O)-methyltransferase [Bdellovibrio sp.]|nr:tRNA (cytidine(34)-2'-O)-methyltransferase [Bdellovibrio sp.]
MSETKKAENLFRIVLVEPEIPQNTGNIGRTCVGTNCELHLIGPMSFEINDTQLKRAGLDYWQHLTWFYYPTYEDWFKKVEDPTRVFYLTTKVKQTYYEPQYQKGDWFVFGKETKGLPPEIINQNLEQAVTIPQTGPVRSLNLATAVAVVIFEGYRQSLLLNQGSKL